MERAEFPTKRMQADQALFCIMWDDMAAVGGLRMTAMTATSAEANVREGHASGTPRMSLSADSGPILAVMPLAVHSPPRQQQRTPRRLAAPSCGLGEKKCLSLRFSDSDWPGYGPSTLHHFHPPLLYAPVVRIKLFLLHELSSK